MWKLEFVILSNKQKADGIPQHHCKILKEIVMQQFLIWTKSLNDNS